MLRYCIDLLTKRLPIGRIGRRWSRAARPLVCRLYSLARRVTVEKNEWLSEIAPHPESEGEYRTNGTVKSFLAEQGAQPFIGAGDRYVEVVDRMSQMLLEDSCDDTTVQQCVQDVLDGLIAARRNRWNRKMKRNWELPPQ